MKTARNTPVLIFVIVGCLGACGAQTPQTERELAGTVESSDGYYPVPGGEAYKDCIFEVPAGARLGQQNGNTTLIVDGQVTREFEPCPYPFRRGTATSQNAPVNLVVNSPYYITWADSVIPQLVGRKTINQWWSKLIAALHVPSNPTGTYSSSQYNHVLYIFPAVMPSNGDTIGQPVLQYGSGAISGGAYWQYASFFVTNSNLFHSTPRLANTGDIIPISMYTTFGDEFGACDWEIDSWVHGVEDNFIWYSNATDRTDAVMTSALEAHNPTSCADYPPDAHNTIDSELLYYSTTQGANTFTAHDLLSLSETQVKANPSPSCGFSTTQGTSSTTLYC